jgi:hypothetical protein
MDKKKIIIAGVIAGAVIIAAVFALSISSQMSGTRTPTDLTGSVSYEKSAPPRSGLETMEVPASTEETVQDFAEAEIPADKKIIKNGDLTLKVTDADESVSQITEAARENGGDIFSSNLYEGTDGTKSGTITVKVPVANFEKTFAEIKKIANLVVRELISAQDVTEQYTDLQSRLKNKQAEEQAFAKILERAGEIDDVLKVTKELARVRGEIEVLQGRIKLLESQTDMATITAQLSEDSKITITDKWRPFQIAKNAASSLLRDIQKYVNFVIVLVIRVIPVIILYFVLIWVVYLLGRKMYRIIKAKKDSTG